MKLKLKTINIYYDMLPPQPGWVVYYTEWHNIFLHMWEYRSCTKMIGSKVEIKNLL